jgi:hypothetical protein
MTNAGPNRFVGPSIHPVICGAAAPATCAIVFRFLRSGRLRECPEAAV